MTLPQKESQMPPDASPRTPPSTKQDHARTRKGECFHKVFISMTLILKIIRSADLTEATARVEAVTSASATGLSPRKSFQHSERP